MPPDPERVAACALIGIGHLLSGPSCRSEVRVPAEQPREAPSTPRGTSVNTAPVSPTTPEATAGEPSPESVVALVTDRKFWPPPLELAEERLRSLGPVKRDQPIPEVLTLIGGRSRVLDRFEVSYSADGKKGWLFVGASFFLGDQDLPRLHTTFKSLLSKQLGKPRWTRKDKGDETPTVGWKLQGRTELTLGKSPS